MLVKIAKSEDPDQTQCYAKAAFLRHLTNKKFPNVTFNFDL